MIVGILRDIAALLGAVAAALLLRRFVFMFVRVQGDSMRETLHNGDRLYVSILSAKLGGYRRGDVVICRYPRRQGFFVKRVIAIPGDTVSVNEGVVAINGVDQNEPYVAQSGLYTRPDWTMPAGAYYVMGDNRRASHDSHNRDVGPVTDVVGKVRAIIWPPGRARVLRYREKQDEAR